MESSIYQKSEENTAAGPFHRNNTVKEGSGRLKYFGYFLLVLLFTAAVIAVLVLPAREVMREADRKTIAGSEKHAPETNFNTECLQLLEAIKSGKLKPLKAANKVKALNSRSNRIMFDGLWSFIRLKEYEESEAGIDYLEFKKMSKNYTRLLGEFRSLERLEKENLFPAYVARDLMIYIFKNRNKVQIHMDDTYMSDSDRKQLTTFYDDGLSVYEYIKHLHKKYYSEEGFFKDVRNFDLLAVCITAKAVEATKGMGFNNKSKLDELSELVKDEKFRLDGRRGAWYKSLPSAIKKLDDTFDLSFNFKKSPNFVEGTWLK